MTKNGLSDTKSDESTFYDLQKAIAENDFDKIEELMKAPVSEEAPAEIPDPVVETAPEQEQEDKTTDSAPEEEPVAEPSDPESQVTEEQPKPPVNTEDELAAIKKQLEAATQQIHRYKSDAGRVPSLQKRLAELEKKLAEPAPAAKTDAQSDEDKRVLEELRNTDPVLASYIEKITKNLAGDNQSLRQQLEQRLRTEDESERQQIQEELERLEYQRLQDMVPVDVGQIFRSNEWEQWKRTLRPADRAYAESSNADHVYAAIQWFGQALQANRSNTQPQQSPSSTDSVQTPQVSTPTPAAAPRVKSGVAAQQPGRTLSESELFSKFYKEIGDRDGLNTTR